MKDLESKLSQYSSKLVEVSVPSINNGNTFKTSPLLRTLDEIGYRIQRIDISFMNGRGEGDAIIRNKNYNLLFVDKIYEEYIRFYGRLPWITKIEDKSKFNDTISDDDNNNNNIANYEEGKLLNQNDQLLSNNIKLDNSLAVKIENNQEIEENGNENKKEFSIQNVNQKLDQLKGDVKSRVLQNVNDVSNFIIIIMILLSIPKIINLTNVIFII